MNLWKLSLRGLRYYRGTSIGTTLGLAVGAMVLIGALMVGDSVRYSLRRIALTRVGAVQLAVIGGDRFFRSETATLLGQQTGLPAAAVVAVEGSVRVPNGDRRAERVQIWGVSEDFFRLGPSGRVPAGWADDSRPVWLNRPLAEHLRLSPGDSLLLRFEKASSVPVDAPLVSDEERVVVLRAEVGGLAGDEEFGLFHLRAEQSLPLSLFMPIEMLQSEIGRHGRANLLLIGGTDAAAGIEKVTAALNRLWTLEDSELSIEEVGGGAFWEVRSARVFLSEPVERLALSLSDQAFVVLTYLVNAIRAGENKLTPYSFVAAVSAGPLTQWAGTGSPPLAPDDVLVHPWLAEDLGIGPGDRIEMDYYVLGPGRTLIERSARFQVAGVVSESSPALDATLMPEFPGLVERESCRDWDPGFPLELDRIRDRDEDYWNRFRGTPKAWIRYETGRALWANRFGSVTAVRYARDSISRDDLRRRLEQRLSPQQGGIRIEPLRAQAMSAVAQSMNFGGLFLAFSVFLIVAALLLGALLFVFGIEQRLGQIGAMLAMGYAPGRIARVFLREGVLLAVAGTASGAIAAWLYTRALLGLLSTVWSSVIGSTPVAYHAGSGSLAIGAAVSFLVGLVVLYLVVRRQARRPAVELLGTRAGVPVVEPRAGRTGRGSGWPARIGLAGLLTAAWFWRAGARSTPGSEAAYFFGSGILVLVSSLAWIGVWLRPERARSGASARSRLRLQIRNLTLRRGRTLTAVGLLSAGAFLVLGSSAFRLPVNTGRYGARSGTGGFALIADLTQPLYRDLDRPAEREYYGLGGEPWDGVTVAQLRVLGGDDASCLNLNRAQRPRLLGVNPEEMVGRFSWVGWDRSRLGGGEADRSWAALDLELPGGAIPGVADSNTILWALGKAVGDEILLEDEQGRLFPVVLVGALANSVLQGNVLVAERHLVTRFPSLSGYRMLLVDAGPTAAPEALAEDLRDTFQDLGVRVESTAGRLNRFNVVPNTYLSMFQLLGMLGLILGCVGLGAVVLRNVMERRAELGLLRAVGFSDGALLAAVLGEHLMVLILGIGVGLVAALVAVGPALARSGGAGGWVIWPVTLAGIALNGGLWTLAAARYSLRGDPIQALRAE